MKTFFKDYWELCKTSWSFCKKHPLGILVYLLVVFGASFVMIYLDPIIEGVDCLIERKRVSKKEDA